MVSHGNGEREGGVSHRNGEREVGGWEEFSGGS